MKGRFVLILSMYECEAIILCEQKVSTWGILLESHFFDQRIKRTEWRYKPKVS
jgi:hypothetical protein